MIGNDAITGLGGMQVRIFELKRLVLMLARFAHLVKVLSAAWRLPPRSASNGSRRTGSSASTTPGATLSAATALNPYIGYDAEPARS